MTAGAPTGTGRPVPAPDERSAPYWAAAAAHILTIARCGRCGTFAVPPDHTCHQCGSTDPRFSFKPVTGRGTVRSWTVVRQSFLPGFDREVPYLLVDVELDEQDELRVIGRLLDGPDTALRIGAPVSLAFEEVTADVSVPAFVLAADPADPADPTDIGARP